jgi:hypothetical protein
MDTNRKLQVGETFNVKIFVKSVPLLPVSFTLQITNTYKQQKRETGAE